jgi:hypothetical protein
MSKQREYNTGEVQDAVLFYVLYQQAGYPFGDTTEGYRLWVATKQREFEHFCNNEAPIQSVEVWAKDDVVVGSGRRLHSDTPDDSCCTICVKQVDSPVTLDIHLSREQAKRVYRQLGEFLKEAN